MKVLFTCGGTAGHINPAVALAQMFQEKKPGCGILFVGADNGMETRLVPREGFELRTVTITNFQRRLSPAGLRHNLTTLRNLRRSRRQAAQILQDFGPDLVVGTGGYASYPVVREAARRGIPTAVHESNACPGLTTKLLARHVDRVVVGFEESRGQYPRPERVAAAGTPVRREFYSMTRQEARERLGLTDSRPLVLSCWGSLGAQVMNGHMADFIVRECREGCPFHHIHGAGRSCAHLREVLEHKGVSLADCPSVDVREYIYDMAAAMAAADVVLCRAGASTISELAALAKPAVLIPSPNVTARHQEKNAQVLEKQGAACVLSEADCGGGVLYDRTAELLQDAPRRSAMSRALKQMALSDGGEGMYRILDELAAGR